MVKIGRASRGIKSRQSLLSVTFDFRLSPSDLESDAGVRGDQPVVEVAADDVRRALSPLGADGEVNVAHRRIAGGEAEAVEAVLARHAADDHQARIALELPVLPEIAALEHELDGRRPRGPDAPALREDVAR